MPLLFAFTVSCEILMLSSESERIPQSAEEFTVIFPSPVISVLPLKIRQAEGRCSYRLSLCVELRIFTVSFWASTVRNVCESVSITAP